MDVAEFDRFADEYLAMHQVNIAVSGDGPEYFARYKIADIKAERVRHGRAVDGVSILDFGAGVGTSTPHVRALFPDCALTSADVSAKSLELNRHRNGEGVRYLAYDGDRLDMEEGSVDIAFAACVFHHIPEAEHLKQLRELRRVLRPGGELYVFEHNPLNPLTRRAVDTCPFDANAVLIRAGVMAARLAQAGLCAGRPVYRYFFPAALRSLRPLERAMRSLPLGAQYFVRGEKPASVSGVAERRAG